MATNKSMRRAAGKVNYDLIITYSWVKYEFDEGYENYITKDKKICVFSNKRDKNIESNDLFKYFEDRQKVDGFTLIEVFYQAEDESQLGVQGMLKWGYFGNRCVIKTIHPNGEISKEVRYGTTDKEYRLDVFEDVIKDVDFVICNPPGTYWDKTYKMISKSGKLFSIWGHQQKILNDAPRIDCMHKKVWGGNTHNKGIEFFVSDTNSYETKPGFSVYTNCEINLKKRELFNPFVTSEEMKDNGLMYKFDNSPVIYNVDEYNNIPKDFRGILSVPVSNVFMLDKNQYNFIGNVNGKRKNEKIGQFCFERMLGINHKGAVQSVTLGVKDGKVCASRSLIEKIA